MATSIPVSLSQKTVIPFGSPGHIMAEGRLNESYITNSGNLVYPANYTFDGTKSPTVDGAIGPAIGTQLTVSPYVEPGTAKICKGYYVYCTEAIRVRTYANNAINLASTHFPIGADIITEPGKNIFISMGDMIIRENWRLSLEYRGMLNTTNKFVLLWSPIFETVSNDFNFDAKAVYYADGDSITFGTLLNVNNNSFVGREIYTGVLRDTLVRGYNKSIRLVNRAVGGWTTAQLDIAIQRREFVYNNPGLITLNMGMNDSVGYTSGMYSTIFDRYMRIIDGYREFSSRCPIVIFKPTKRQNATEQLLLENIRTIIDDVVTTRADPRIKKIDLGGNAVFPDTANSRYNQEDGIALGLSIHPSKSQHLIMGNYAAQQIAADPAFLALIPNRSE